MVKNLLPLLFALACAEYIHNSLEVWGMRQKVEWLEARLDKRKHGTWPVNIDTKLKTALLHAAILILITALAWQAAVWLKLSNEQLVGSAIIILFLNYVSTTITVDAFHREIGLLLKRYKVKD